MGDGCAVAATNPRFLLRILGQYNIPEHGVEGAPGPVKFDTDPTLKKFVRTAAEKARTGDTNCARQTEDEVVYVKARFLENLSGTGDKPWEINPLNILPRATASGSVTQDRFLDINIHFVQNLPERLQGKAIILLLDGKPPAGPCLPSYTLLSTTSLSSTSHCTPASGANPTTTARTSASTPASNASRPSTGTEGTMDLDPRKAPLPT